VAYDLLLRPVERDSNRGEKYSLRFTKSVVTLSKFGCIIFGGTEGAMNDMFANSRALGDLAKHSHFADCMDHSLDFFGYF
jgi:hypothetical protein